MRHKAQTTHTLRQIGARFDAGETAIFTRQLEHVKAEIVDAEFPALRAREFIPQESGVNPGADTFTWREFTRVGLAEMISNYSTDLPDVTEYGQENKSPIESIGVSFKYNLQEVKAAGMSGYALESRRGIIAREAIERKIDKVAAHGDSGRNVPGFVNNSSVTLVTAGINGDWDGAATPAEILEDLHTMSMAVWEQSKHIHRADTMLLGTTLYKIIATTPYSTTIPDSLLDVFLRSSPHIRTVDAWVQLDLADAEGNGPRAVVYEKSPMNMGLIVPVDFESLPPQPENLNFKVPCHARVGLSLIHI